MTRGELLRITTEQFQKAGIVDPRVTAERLLTAVLEIDRTSLYLNPDLPVDSSHIKRLDELVQRRLENEPLEYILGECEFYGLTLVVKPGVLIPRPETELIVDLAKLAAPVGGFPLALDIGCGTGALALTLLEEGIAGNIVAVDASGTAVQVTRENTELLGHQKRLQVVHADVFVSAEHFLADKFPLIVSNPPYVTEREWQELPLHIKEHEPRQALASGEDGLDFHRKLTHHLPDWLAADGVFFGEIGSGQGAAALELHKQWAGIVRLHRDYAGHDRIIEARL